MSKNLLFINLNEIIHFNFYNKKELKAEAASSNLALSVISTMKIKP